MLILEVAIQVLLFSLSENKIANIKLLPVRLVDDFNFSEYLNMKVLLFVVYQTQLLGFVISVSYVISCSVYCAPHFLYIGKVGLLSVISLILIHHT